MRADFYLLKTPLAEISDFVCRLLQKIYQQKLSAYLYVDSLDAAKKWDALLWAFDDISFLPHALHTETTLDVPLYIGHTLPTIKPDVLINLTTTIPDTCETFSRVVEVVSQEENLREQARKKYQTYQKLNFQLHINHI